MANKNFQKKKIQDAKDSGFGNYKEGVGGGGSPRAKDPTKRAPGVNSNYRQSNNNTMQARTKDGKFTYKSVNGESIDPKYGPSRGKTVNPLLTGGENGIKIEDVENEFIDQKGAYWDKYKDKWYNKGGEFVVGNDWKVRVAGDAIWNVAKRRYDSVKGEFVGESEVFSETKKGRPGKDEAAAKQKAQASGEEQAVIDQKTGGIKLKPGTVLSKPTPKPQPQPAAPTAPTPVVPNGGNQQPTAPVNTVQSGDIANADYTPKYNDDEISEVVEILRQQGFSDEEIDDFNNLSPKEKDEYIDKNFSTDEGDADSDNANSDNASSPEQTSSDAPAAEDKDDEKKEDSEVVKKIKDMGFSD